jgi:hypothetical protein
MPFQVIPEFSPGAPSGACFTCKASLRDGDVVVDCDFDVEDLLQPTATELPGMAFELASGPLQICSTCVREMARLVGMVPIEDLEALSDSLYNSEENRKRLMGQLDTANHRLAAYKVIAEEQE